MLSLLWGVLFSALVSYWANKRGYGWWAYFFASPIIGAIALYVLPDLNEAGKEFENKKELVKNGNLVGIVISILTIGFFTYLGSLK